MAGLCVTDRARLEFCRLPNASSTVFTRLFFRIPGRRLTSFEWTNTLAHQAMDTTSLSTIKEIVSNIRSKTISPIEIVEAHLKRIEKLQPRLNVFHHLDADAARKAAHAAETAVSRGAQLGPLHGVPLTIKSCIDVAGWPCPAGSLLRKAHVPRQDAPLVTRLKAAGAILVGNTNTPEFLMAYETDNLLVGKTSNPWDLTRSAGGSSGGEAAAIAAGCSTGGVGSDGGGSIRVPAHFCGICGLKPTPGRIPSTGHFPPGAGAFPLRTHSENELRGLRVGILESEVLGTATPETLAAVERAAKSLSEREFIVEPFRLAGLDRALELWWLFFGPVIGHLLRQSVAGHEAEISPMLLEYLSCATSGSPITLDQFIEACAKRDLLRAEILRQLQDVPILLSPISSITAFHHGGGNYKPGTGYRDTMRYSQWLNLAGFPGASVPVGVSSEGLPIGVQVIGRPFEEDLVLAIAEAIEQARGPWQRPPLLDAA